MESSADLTAVYVIVIILIIFIVLGIVRWNQQKKWGYCQSTHRLKGKTFLITGADSGVGYQTAKSIAERGGRVIFACADADSAKKAIKDIRKSIDRKKRGEMLFMPLDLSSLDAIRQFVEVVKVAFDKIDVLINNASPTPVGKEDQTKDGFEVNFGVNHLGHFLLTNLLLDRLKSAAPSRIVIVSSILHEHGHINMEDLNSMKTPEGQEIVGKMAGLLDPSFCNTKLMNVYFGKALVEKTKEMGIDVHIVCPGFTFADLSRYSMKWYHHIMFSPIYFLTMKCNKQGAQTILTCATDNTLQGKSGSFYADCKPYELKIQYDTTLQEQLWRVSEGLGNGQTA